jgi:hypothetical protein
MKETASALDHKSRSGSCVQIEDVGKFFKGRRINTILMHVSYAIVKNVLESIADMGPMNHAKIKVKDSI